MPGGPLAEGPEQENQATDPAPRIMLSCAAFARFAAALDAPAEAMPAEAMPALERLRAVEPDPV